jgi:outer membrane protein OmpA-like peptidoglycan-associated protein
VIERSLSPARRSWVATLASPRIALQRKCDCGRHTLAGGECEECKKKETTLQRHPDGSAGTNSIPPIVREVLDSPGQPLDRNTRTFFEPRFGRDFSQVRVHTDTKAADSATSVNALAYTVGHDVVFGPGQYESQDEKSHHLLAHELTHVVQQASGRVGTDSESKARASEEMISRGKAIDSSSLGDSPVSLQKAGKDDPLGGSAAASAASHESTEPPIDGFEFDKTEIPREHLQRLAALRARLISVPSATVILTGHTDTVGTEKYNEGLGLRRAIAVREFLTKQKGASPVRIKVASKGETEPAAGQPPAKLDPSKGEKNARNRRVELQVIGLPPMETPTDRTTREPAKQPSKESTFGPTDPSKKKPLDLNLPKDYQPTPPKPTPSGGVITSSSAAGEKKEGGPEVEAAVVGGVGTIETTVEVTWEAKSGLGKKLRSQISVTLHVGPKGFDQLEADLTVLKKKIKDSTLGGTVRDLTFSVGVNPGLNLDRDAANRLVTTFSEKAKLSLEADLIIPKTSWKIPVEISGSVDVQGKPGLELKFKIFTW